LPESQLQIKIAVTFFAILCALLIRRIDKVFDPDSGWHWQEKYTTGNFCFRIMCNADGTFKRGAKWFIYAWSAFFCCLFWLYGG
jgi:hypothetical protein